MNKRLMTIRIKRGFKGDLEASKLTSSWSIDCIPSSLLPKTLPSTLASPSRPLDR